MADKVYQQPRLTFSALADVMSPHTPAGMRSIVRDSKYPRRGPILSYTNATRHMVGMLVDGRPPSIELRDYEREVVEAFDRERLKLLRGCEIWRSNTRDRAWVHCGVEISMFAEVSVLSAKGNGCVKLHCAKEPLAKGVGKAMASLMAHYRTTVLSDQDTNPAYCLVYEVRTGKVHKAPVGPASEAFLAKIADACEMVKALWPSARPQQSRARPAEARR